MTDKLKPCPCCNESLNTDVLGRPMASICRNCEERILKQHKEDQLKNCPFCNGSDLKHTLSVPFYFGAEGVTVRCNKCGAKSGLGSITKRITFDLAVPPIFNEETIHNGFEEANNKWNRRAENDL